MEAKDKSLKFLGEKKQLTVPFFQRRYVWKEENWDELLKSFEDSSIKPFLGSIILKEVSGEESLIVDGQQRLTTITILAKAIYDCLPDTCKTPTSGTRSYIENMLFYRVNAVDDFKDSHIRIQHSKIDADDYNTVIKAQVLNDESIDLDTINENSSCILRCYKYYRRELENRGEDALKTLFNCLFDGNRKVIVLITLKHDDVNEQTIFDTINRAGIRLSTADIIKNNLFKNILDKCRPFTDDRKYALEAYEEYWGKTFYSKQEISDLWDRERVFGNVKHNNLEFLLYCVACIKWGEDTDMFSKLETVFDRETASMGFNELINLVKEIKEYADIFKKYILDLEKALEDEQDLYFRYDDKIRGLLLILQKFGIQMFYPYVIMRLKEVNQNESDPQLREDFQILESFVVRRKLSPKGTHDYTSKCYEIIKHKIGALIQSDLGNRDAGLTDADIKRYLSNTKDDTAKMVLFWIELRRRRGDAYDINALEYNYTLEHIMPKKWKTHWSEVPIVDGKTVYDKDSDDGIHYRDSMIQSIGNKTLLKSSLNSAVKNADFMTKIKGIDGRRPGYDQHTALMLTRDLVAKSQTDQNWDEKHISDRTNQLFGEFVQIWPSFADRVQVSAPISDEDPNIDQFTQEQLSDAALLAEIL